MKKDKNKKHDSWLFALWSLLVDTFISRDTFNEDLDPVFDVSRKLGKKGKERQNKLFFAGALIFCGIMIALSLSLWAEDRGAACAGAGIFGAIAVLTVIFRENFFK